MAVCRNDSTIQIVPSLHLSFRGRRHFPVISEHWLGRISCTNKGFRNGFSCVVFVCLSFLHISTPSLCDFCNWNPYIPLHFLKMCFISAVMCATIHFTSFQYSCPRPGPPLCTYDYMYEWEVGLRVSCCRRASVWSLALSVLCYNNYGNYH